MRVMGVRGGSAARLRKSGPVALAAAATSAVVAIVGVMPAQAADLTPPALSLTADNTIWGTNSRVMSILDFGDKALIGGDFDYVGPSLGHSTVVDPTTGAVAEAAKMTNGNVNAAVADGSGGYYLGGEFAQVDGASKRGVVHIGADGKVDRTFKAQVTGAVYALALSPSGTTLYIGGKLTAVNGTTVSNVGAVDAVTGATITAFHPSPNSTVYALAATDTSVYLGGAFSAVGFTRRGIARVSASTGSVDSTFTGTTGATVRSLALSPDGTVLYAGGDFTSATSTATGTLTRNRLAAYATSNGAVTAWNPGASASVSVVLPDPSTGDVYVGGQFATLGGVTRTSLGSVTSAGAATGWDPGIVGCREAHLKKTVGGLAPCTPWTSALALSNGMLYAGGNFSTAGGVVRHGAADWETSTGNLGAWNPVVGNKTFAIVPSATGIVLGGEFTSVGGIVEQGLALIDLTTGKADPAFTGSQDGMVLDMVKTADGLGAYVAGDFNTVDGASHPNIVKIDAATGAVDGAFSAKPNSDVWQMSLAGNALYIGGKFKRVGNIARVHAAKLDPLTGAVDPTWVANTTGPAGKLRANGMVMGIQATPDGSKVFLAGPFQTINGTTVTGGIAVLNGTTGAFLPNQIGGVMGCGGVGPWINRLYISDDGLRLYGGDVCPDYVYQWDTVNLGTPSNPTGLLWRDKCNGGMQGRLEVNGHFYYGTHGGNKGSGGSCTAYPNGPNVTTQQRFWVYGSTDGYLLPYAPEFDSPMGVWSFAASPEGLLVGGDFSFAGARDVVQQGFALFRGTP